MKQPPVPVLFVTGIPGSGKTALSHEISELLWRIREPHAVIDIDELARGVLPDETTDFYRPLATRNLAAVWQNFAAAGARRAVLARVIRSPQDIEHFVATIPRAELSVCCITADRHTIAARLHKREPGLALRFLLGVADDLATAIADQTIPSISVHNGPETSITTLAYDVLGAIGWPRPDRDTFE